MDLQEILEIGNPLEQTRTINDAGQSHVPERRGTWFHKKLHGLVRLLVLLPIVGESNHCAFFWKVVSMDSVSDLRQLLIKEHVRPDTVEIILADGVKSVAQFRRLQESELRQKYCVPNGPLNMGSFAALGLALRAIKRSYSPNEVETMCEREKIRLTIADILTGEEFGFKSLQEIGFYLGKEEFASIIERCQMNLGEKSRFKKAIEVYVEVCHPFLLCISFVRVLRRR
jgi:hypothetical protein